ANALNQTIGKMAEDLAALIASPDRAVLVGVLTHGVGLARRIQDRLAREHGWSVPLGSLDTTLYRDDFHQLDRQPAVRPTRIDFDVTDKIVILCDDVLCTGRTIRCALDEIMDFGRPRAIRLAALVDRGRRELPIQPDVVGIAAETTPEQRVEVRFREGAGDEEEGVWIHETGDSSP
ncbi:MAG TPA: bifunctional pyr operon transcriptional regulator/uracil phosphoribosyltransferase PyrR, partial [Sumerlaeia bacterium]|nr:bifunctional pyr operon transcriptional regulator/uracil phosphoribosyltransferase PyrR [Sumerlaeia bacterium]